MATSLRSSKQHQGRLFEFISICDSSIDIGLKGNRDWGGLVKGRGRQKWKTKNISGRREKKMIVRLSI